MGASHSHSQKRAQSAASTRCHQYSYPASTGGSVAHGSQPNLSPSAVVVKVRRPSAATMSSKQRRKSGTSYKVLLDKKATFLGRYFARQFSDAVLERLRMHVRQSNGSKTRIRLFTDGVAVGSKNSNLFLNAKPPYEFFPLAAISDIIVESELRNVLLLIQELADGTLEILAYRLINEAEARLFQQTFDEIAVKVSGRGQLYAQKQPAGNWTFTTTARPVDNVDSHHGTWRSAQSRPAGGYHSMTMLNDGTTRRTGNYWSTSRPVNADGYVYRLRSEDSLGTPASRRRRMHHKSDSDATTEDIHYRRDIEELTREVSELRTAMRERSLSANDNSSHVIHNNNNRSDYPPDDGPIRVVFTKDGIIETHGASSVVREGGSDSGSDRDSGIHSKDMHHGVATSADLVDGGACTVRASSGDYRSGHRTTATSRHRSTAGSMEHSDMHDTGRMRGQQHSYDNGFATTGHVSHRSGGYGPRSVVGTTNHVFAEDMYVKKGRGISPAPSVHSRTQSEGGWRLRPPWRRRSQSADARQQGQRWDTASMIIGGKAARKIYVPDGQVPPERIILYPTVERNIRSRHASRYEL